METGFNGMLSGFPEVLSCSVLRPNKEYILQRLGRARRGPKHGILNKYLHPNGQERIFPIIAF
jgi:hypothetical protein